MTLPSADSKCQNSHR